MTKTTATNDGIPTFLKRQTNKLGITLSAGEAKPATVKAAKTPKPEKPVKEPKPAKVAKPKKEKAPKAVKSTPVTTAPALNSDGTPVEKVVRSIVPLRFKERYKSHAGTCGDDMALELKAATTTLNADKRETLDVEALWAIAKGNGIDVTKYLDLNNGQKRMNVGNKLRGLLKAGTDVTIGTRTFRAEDLEV